MELKMALPVVPRPFGASPGARHHEDIVGVERFVAFEPQPFQAPGRFAIVLVTDSPSVGPITGIRSWTIPDTSFGNVVRTVSV